MIATSLVRKLSPLPRNRPSTHDLLQEEILSIFRARPGGDQAQPLTQDRTRVGQRSDLTFEAGSGLNASICWPLKRNPALSPPEFQRQLQIDMSNPGSSGWLALVIPIDTAALMHARHLFWELAGQADAVRPLMLELRNHPPGRPHNAHALGQVELGPDRSVASRTLDITKISIAADATSALHIFLPLAAGARVTLDYILAHHD